ncbi:hypothetical protein BCR39DRAFT_508271 [Naematelia encephala]|uniref:Uncharacterized protein n=1 Tax=Naematelia encephala TaxID=71784 RepID=A0A1Y2AHB6_9TREE|nr:hypothetical protein BCR39DRAFT_508271 [Naematelia encephala]
MSSSLQPPWRLNPSRPLSPQSTTYQSATIAPKSFQAGPLGPNRCELSTFQSNSFQSNPVMPSSHPGSLLQGSSYSIPVGSMSPRSNPVLSRPSQSIGQSLWRGTKQTAKLEEGKTLSEIIDPDSLYNQPQDFDQDAEFTRNPDNIFERTSQIILTCEVQDEPLLLQLTIVQSAFPRKRAIQGWPPDMKRIIPDGVSSVKVQSGRLQETKTYQKQFSEQTVVHMTVQNNGTLYWTTLRPSNTNGPVRKNIGGVVFSDHGELYGPYDVYENVHITNLEEVTELTESVLRSTQEQSRLNRKHRKRERESKKRLQDRVDHILSVDQSTGGSKEIFQGYIPGAELSSPWPSSYYS